MLRRVARASCLALLLVVGVALVLWLPVSFWFSVTLDMTTAGGDAGSGAEIESQSGVLCVRYLRGSLAEPSIEVGPAHGYRSFVGDLINPYFPTVMLADGFNILSLPLWLLAAVCLAWPVTSLLVRRRRRGR